MVNLKDIAFQEGLDSIRFVQLLWVNNDDCDIPLHHCSEDICRLRCDWEIQQIQRLLYEGFPVG